MANSAEIGGQVDLLADAYNRHLRDDTRIYDAYQIALSDIDAESLKRGVTALLRDRLAFMPSPAEVRAHALASKDYARQRETEDDRRMVCARCQDSGYIHAFNRRWIAEFRDQFTPEWFVAGWMRESFLHCVREYREDLIVLLICGCNCRRTGMFTRQVERWKSAKDEPSTKAPRPAFLNTFDPDWDCLFTRREDKEKTTEQFSGELLLAFGKNDNRTWTGNWTP
jgi:hypothetical protein